MKIKLSKIGDVLTVMVGFIMVQLNLGDVEQCIETVKYFLNKAGVKFDKVSQLVDVEAGLRAMLRSHRLVKGGDYEYVMEFSIKTGKIEIPESIIKKASIDVVGLVDLFKDIYNESIKEEPKSGLKLLKDELKILENNLQFFNHVEDDNPLKADCLKQIAVIKRRIKKYIPSEEEVQKQIQDTLDKLKIKHKD